MSLIFKYEHAHTDFEMTFTLIRSTFINWFTIEGIEFTLAHL